MYMGWQTSRILYAHEREKYLLVVERKYGKKGLIKYLEAEKEQRGKCKICQRQMILVGNHKPGTKKFRGLLCMWCNSILGNIERMPWVLRNLKKYLGA